MKRTLVAAILLLLTLLRSGEAAVRPIQGQGSSPYCLFAVNAYLIGADMWRLEAEYHRRGLPVWPGTIIPHNDAILQLGAELYGVRWQVLPEGDWPAARAAVVAGHETAFTGQGHAIVVLRFERGRVFYVDSLRPGQVLSMSEAELRAWWDGWAWHRVSS